MDERIEVAPAGLEQQHAGARILAQAVGQDAAGGAGTNDDVIVALCHDASFRLMVLALVTSESGGRRRDGAPAVFYTRKAASV